MIQMEPHPETLPETKPRSGPFPTFVSLACRIGGFLCLLMLKYIPRYRYAIIAIALFAVVMIGMSWRESERTRPTRELHTQLARRMITAHNLSQSLRSQRIPFFWKGWFFPERVEADDLISLIFWSTAINRETMELAARVKKIHDLNFPNQEFKPQDLQPFASHTEIQGLTFRHCPLTDAQFAEILDIFPNLKWVFLEDVPLTDKSADLLLARKISLRAPSAKISFSRSALNRLQAAKLTTR